MLSIEQLKLFIELRKIGHNNSQISRLMGVSRPTVIKLTGQEKELMAYVDNSNVDTLRKRRKI